jgi:hypothetical protein
MVSTVVGIHPLFVFLLGLLLARGSSSFRDERVAREVLLVKGVGTVLIVIGCVLIGQV